MATPGWETRGFAAGKFGRHRADQSSPVDYVHRWGEGHSVPRGPSACTPPFAIGAKRTSQTARDKGRAGRQKCASAPCREEVSRILHAQLQKLCAKQETLRAEGPDLSANDAARLDVARELLDQSRSLRHIPKGDGVATMSEISSISRSMRPLRLLLQIRLVELPMQPDRTNHAQTRSPTTSTEPSHGRRWLSKQVLPPQSRLDAEETTTPSTWWLPWDTLRRRSARRSCVASSATK